MSTVRMLHFLKDLWKFIQIHQYYTMALKTENLNENLSLHIIENEMISLWSSMAEEE